MLLETYSKQVANSNSSNLRKILYRKWHVKSYRPVWSMCFDVLCGIRRNLEELQRLVKHLFDNFPTE